MSNQLQRIIQGAKALEKARTIPDVKVIRDQAKAIADYCKQQKYAGNAAIDAKELQLRAERKLGNLIPEQFPQGRPQKTSHDATFLKDSGISKTQSSRWQKVAVISEPEFEQYVFDERTKGKEPTVSGAIRKTKRKHTEIRLKEIETNEPAPAAGKYDVIVVDPPWPMEKVERDCRENQTVHLDYPTMTLEQVSTLEIPSSENCHLWMWTTQRFLPSAFPIVESWGFSYVCCFVWNKNGGFQPFGLPQYNCEFALYARRGSPIFLDTKDFKLCFGGSRAQHSEKPDAFYDMVRRTTSGRRLDMFNRRPIRGFDTWGKEAK